MLGTIGLTAHWWLAPLLLLALPTRREITQAINRPERKA
jgi:hypothetical protein